MEFKKTVKKKIEIQLKYSFYKQFFYLNLTEIFSFFRKKKVENLSEKNDRFIGKENLQKLKEFSNEKTEEIKHLKVKIQKNIEFF